MLSKNVRATSSAISLVLREADAADSAARADDAERGLDRLVVTDALENGVDAEAARELTDALDRLLATLADDVCRAEVARECDPVGVTTEEDDLLRAEPLCGDHPAEPDGAVTDDSDRLARCGSCGERCVMARCPSRRRG